MFFAVCRADNGSETETRQFCVSVQGHENPVSAAGTLSMSAQSTSGEDQRRHHRIVVAHAKITRQHSDQVMLQIIKIPEYSCQGPGRSIAYGATSGFRFTALCFLAKPLLDEQSLLTNSSVILSEGRVSQPIRPFKRKMLLLHKLCSLPQEREQ